MTTLDQLAALAAAATPGPWVQIDGTTTVDSMDGDDRWPLADALGNAADAAYIAAADPATVQALVAVVRAAQAYRDAWDGREAVHDGTALSHLYDALQPFTEPTSPEEGA